MSINAVVMSALKQSDGSTRLELGGPERGQPALYTNNPPGDIEQLIGCQVWGGSGFLMCGETRIGDREGYTGLRFTVDAIGPIVSRDLQKR